MKLSVLLCMVILFGCSAIRENQKNFVTKRPTPGDRQVASSNFWRNGNGVGSQVFWRNGSGPGSEAFWRNGTGVGSQVFWVNGSGVGSQNFWVNGSGVGSQNFWVNGSGVGSQNYWVNGSGPSLVPIPDARVSFIFAEDGSVTAVLGVVP